MLIANRSPYSYFLKNQEYPIPAGSTLEVNNALWTSDDELARSIESLDRWNIVSVSDVPVNYPRTRAFPEVINLIGGMPAEPSLPTLILRDSTGGTLFQSNVADPTPVTSYTVVRDDLGAAADPSSYPILPDGIYMVGGYVDWVPDAGFIPPAGKVVAYMNLDIGGGSAYPEGDLGYGTGPTPLAEHGNYIEAPTKLVSAPGGASELNMQMLYFSINPSEVFTWVRWVFWATKVA